MMRSDMPKENNTFIRASFTSESREYRAENFMSDCENIISHYFALVKCCQDLFQFSIVIISVITLVITVIKKKQPPGLQTKRLFL